MLKSTWIAIAVILLGAPVVSAQSTIRHHVLASGGLNVGHAARVLASIGETVAGRTGGGGSEVCVGYGCSVASGLSGSATAVFLSFFDATLQAHAVALEWEVLSAASLAGFNIYRSDSPEGSYSRLNEEVLSGPQVRRFVDRTVEPERQYSYKLGAIDSEGEFLSEPRNVTTPRWVTELRANYPNPFNPRTKVEFYLATPGKVSLRVYDEKGRLVTTLLQGDAAPGTHVVPWDGTDSNHHPVSSGVYFTRLVTAERTLTSKMTLVK